MMAFGLRAGWTRGAILTLLCSTAPQAAPGCSGQAHPCTREVNMLGFKGKASQVELQQDVQRYATAMVERAADGFEPLLRSTDPARVDQAMRLYLLYASSAFEAATGPVPEVNALDLLVFASLTRANVDRYWLPSVMGENALRLQAAMEQSERELWDWAARVLTREKREQLRGLIELWLAQNPDQVRVESVRFNEFSSVAADVERAKTATGVLASVRAATRTADSALLLSERTLYLAQRAPFLVRLQARLGAREVLADSAARLQEADELFERTEGLIREAQKTRPLIHDLVELTAAIRDVLAEGRALALEARPFVTAVEPLLRERTTDEAPRSTGLEELVSNTRELNESVRQTLSQLGQLGEAARSREGTAQQWLARALRRAAIYGAAIALTWTLLFWSAYYAARRLADARAESARTDESDE